MDITEFYDTFFEEADELLAEMESHLLELDVDNPDVERLNAIFRAAHSIKGGAGTFGFEALQRTTHLLENLLDYTRRGELALRRDIVDTFLEAKDMLNDQLDAYRQGGEPDPEALERICETLRRLALEELGEDAGAVRHRRGDQMHRRFADRHVGVNIGAPRLPGQICPHGALGLAGGAAGGKMADDLVAIIRQFRRCRLETGDKIHEIGMLRAGLVEAYEVFQLRTRRLDALESETFHVFDARRNVGEELQVVHVGFGEACFHRRPLVFRQK